MPAPWDELIRRHEEKIRVLSDAVATAEETRRREKAAAAAALEEMMRREQTAVAALGTERTKSAALQVPWAMGRGTGFLLMPQLRLPAAA